MNAQDMNRRAMDLLAGFGAARSIRTNHPSGIEASIDALAAWRERVVAALDEAGPDGWALAGALCEIAWQMADAAARLTGDEEMTGGILIAASRDMLERSREEGQ